MDIPKVCSAPLDPSAPSLLTLPAEIRNRINELVFVQREPILIHNADYYYNRGRYGPAEKSSTSSDERAGHVKDMEYESRNKRYYKSLERWRVRHYAEKQDAQLFRNEVSHGLGLLKSCRQIYHETASILYSGNTFVISRVRYSHDRYAIREGDCDGKECIDYHQFSYTPVWLASLGSQIKRLKKVVIDVSAVCDHSYAYDRDIPNLLPLLRTMWSGVMMQCDVAFAHTDRMTKCAILLRPSLPEANATHLNRALAALTHDDTLHLRRFSDSRSLITSLKMFANGYGGSVQYCRGLGSVSRAFDIDEESEKAVWKTFLPSTSPTHLPQKLRNIICRYIFTPGQSLRLAISRSLRLHFDRGVFDVSSDFRLEFTRAVMQYVPVTIELKTTEADMRYNALDPTRKFYLHTQAFISLCGRRYIDDEGDEDDGSNGLITQIVKESVVKEHYAEYQQNTETTFLVRVSLSRPMQPADVRINTRQLLYWLASIPHGSVKNEVFITIQLQYCDGESLHCQTNTTAVGELKMAMFLHFTDILSAEYAVSGQCGPEQPELWIDGYGNLMDTFPTSKKFLINHTDSIKSELGANRIRRLLDEIEARINQTSPICTLSDSELCICLAWRDLRPWAETVWEREQSCLGED